MHKLSLNPDIASHDIALKASVTSHQYYKNESPEFREGMKALVEEHHCQAMADYKRQVEDPVTIEDQAWSLNSAFMFLQPIANIIADRYGQVVSIMMCEKVSDQDEVNVLSVHSNHTRGVVDEMWPHYNRQGFNQASNSLRNFGRALLLAPSPENSPSITPTALPSTMQAASSSIMPSTLNSSIGSPPTSGAMSSTDVRSKHSESTLMSTSEHLLDHVTWVPPELTSGEHLIPGQKWLKAYRESYLYMLNLHFGKDFEALVNAFFMHDEAWDFKPREVARLETYHCPEILGTFIQYARGWAKGYPINDVDYSQEFGLWYKSLQPEARIQGLTFWGQALAISQKPKDVTTWLNAVHDFGAVLDVLTPPHHQSKRCLTVSDSVSKPVAKKARRT
ncbi:hypothetical protein EWM64_g2028 [Hericium alpestre]|uniref:Uncharacterized protein n=1 Tax=Hericium alpestre TaxID=135208 RepID=A0A4Z0A6K4_9AGAM|nr:hypothetical protein EWM64_g2028 [Hericium alpestre]